MRNFLIALVLVVILGGGYYWYSSQKAPEGSVKEEAAETTPEPASNTGMQQDMTATTPTSPATSGTGVNVNVSGSVSTGTTKEFTVSGSNYSFTPNTLTVKKGDTVKITFKNSGGTHNLILDGYGIGTKTIQGGAEESISFVADKAGSFEYYCSVGQHRAMGMKGTLTVQ